MRFNAVVHNLSFQFQNNNVITTSYEQFHKQTVKREVQTLQIGLIRLRTRGMHLDLMIT